MRYELLKSSNVKLIVYDITGTFVVQLVDQKQDAGTYEVDFSGNNLSSGIYFYQIYILNEKGGELDSRPTNLKKGGNQSS